MATAVDRGIAILEAVKDGTVTAQEASDFINLYMLAYPAEDSGGTPIPSPTNEEKAQHFIRKVYDLLELSIRRGQVREAAQTASTTTTTLFGPRP